MATNDFLAAGGDGYDMLGGEREEGISLDSVLIEYLKSATSLRLYRAATTIDLAQYKEPFPGERIVSISEEAYKELIGGGETPKPDPKPDPKSTPETPVATNKQNQAGARQSNPSVTEKKSMAAFYLKRVQKQKRLHYMVYCSLDFLLLAGIFINDVTKLVSHF